MQGNMMNKKIDAGDGLGDGGPIGWRRWLRSAEKMKLPHGEAGGVEVSNYLLL
ncbi:hypothetical protein A2U01_0071326 [Trifolium medium]|uniref:Uncharacterized protein n=1 Tax=Trifolium medium TaxID=97028 RepID=A0A392SNT6_9FABA|nr:hypothetical protein [Trifolium medium]